MSGRDKNVVGVYFNWFRIRYIDDDHHQPLSLGDTVRESLVMEKKLGPSWVCEECGETISEDNFWTHPHKRYRGIE